MSNLILLKNLMRMIYFKDEIMRKCANCGKLKNIGLNDKNRVKNALIMV